MLSVHPLDAGGYSGGPAVAGLLHVAVEVLVGQYGTAYGSHADGLVENPQLLQHLRRQTVDDAVGTAGTVVELLIRETVGFFEYDRHYFAPPSIAFTFSTTPSGVGIMPPERP